MRIAGLKPHIFLRPDIRERYVRSPGDCPSTTTLPCWIGAERPSAFALLSTAQNRSTRTAPRLTLRSHVQPWPASPFSRRPVWRPPLFPTDTLANARAYSCTSSAIPTRPGASTARRRVSADPYAASRTATGIWVRHVAQTLRGSFRHVAAHLVSPDVRSQVTPNLGKERLYRRKARLKAGRYQVRHSIGFKRNGTGAGPSHASTISAHCRNCRLLPVWSGNSAYD